MLLNRLGKSNAGLFFCLLASFLLLLQFYYLHESRIKLSRQDRSDIIYDIFNETLGVSQVSLLYDVSCMLTSASSRTSL